MLKKITTSSYVIFIVAIVLGYFLPQGASVTFFLILPALTVILTVTLLRFPKGFFHKPKKLVPAMLLGNLMNYLILGNLIILGSIFLIRNEKIWIGMVLIAAIPSAVTILSLSEKIRGDKMLTLAGFAGTYLAAIILIPLIGVAFLKFIPVSYPKLIVLILSLVGLPLLFSRIAVDRNWEEKIENHAGIITDVCYFFVYYTLTACNADLIGTWPIELILIAAIVLSSIFLVGAVFFLIRKIYKFNEGFLSSLLLFGTMKNYGLAGAIALYVFGNEPALPALIFSLFMFLYGIWLTFRTRFQTPAPSENPESSIPPDSNEPPPELDSDDDSELL